MIRKKKIGILTGGGDVQPLNTVIDAAKRESENRGIQLIGFLKRVKTKLPKT
jgi:6-phosphofructokinase 1